MAIMKNQETEEGALKKIAGKQENAQVGRTGCAVIEGNWGENRRPKVEVREGERFWGLEAVIVYKEGHYFIVERKSGKAWVIDGENVWKWVGARS